MPQDKRQRGARYVYAMCEACGASATGKREAGRQRRVKRGVKREEEQAEGKEKKRGKSVEAGEEGCRWEGRGSGRQFGSRAESSSGRWRARNEN